LTRVKHQLLIHLDYGDTLPSLEVRYSYPFSTPHRLPEQAIAVPKAKIPGPIKKDLDYLYRQMSDRIPPPTPVRLPHAHIVPDIRPAIMTVVVQDQQRQTQIPLARLYYHEEVLKLGSRIEAQVRMGPADFSGSERAAWERLRVKIKRMAWEHYVHMMREYFLSP
jgi:hypothetical protein